MYDELYHYGVLGMKWGVRRYQNYDGSYTKAGMKRYQSSLDEYNRQKERVTKLKESGANKSQITNAKVAATKAKRKLNKDYKHLKQDKMADKGKELYARGYTIRGKNKALSMMTRGGSTAIFSAMAYSKLVKLGVFRHGFYIGNKYVSTDTFTDYVNNNGGKLIVAALGLNAANIAGQAATQHTDKKLRAYYNHTSNY